MVLQISASAFVLVKVLNSTKIKNSFINPQERQKCGQKFTESFNNSKLDWTLTLNVVNKP